MRKKRIDMIRPGRFGSMVWADNWRDEFDVSNETILYHRIPVDFVFLGDSITNGWDLNAYFGRNGKYVVNRGIPGDTTVYALKRFAADVLQLKPGCVIIKIGINNMAPLDAWKEEERRDPEDIFGEIAGDLRKMAELSLENGIATVLCSLLPTCIEQLTTDIARRALVLKVNEEIERICADTGAVYVDYHSHMVLEDGKTLRPELAYDGLHPHVLGYDIMAEVLRRKLDRQGISI